MTLFAVADALGVDPGKLNPAGGSLFYQVQSLRLRYREAKAAANRAVTVATVARERLVALMLASEIREGRSAFTVHGTPHQFVELVAQALSSEYGTWRVGAAHEVIGIDGAEVEREHQAILEREFPHLDLAADEDGDDEDYFAAEHRAYLKVFASWLPSLKFVANPDGRFRVDEINVDDDSRLISDESMSDIFESFFGTG